jgi:hypothetical protein
MTRVSWNYPFFSAGIHVGQTNKIGLIDIAYWHKLSRDMNWMEIVWQRLDKDGTVDLLSRYRRSRPLGSDKFISNLDVTLGRRLRPCRAVDR